MAYRKIQFAKGEIYHIVTRAIDGVDLFRDNKDYLRMIHDLFEFNDAAPVVSNFRVNYIRNPSNVTKQGLVTLLEERRERKLLVEILVFCLMPNHVHLLVRELQDGGISRFMQKLGGYALYYNKKYQRRGHLFQDKFRAVHIENDKQLITVFVYIHTNPVSIIYPKWREKGIGNVKRAIQYIENYRWSSYADYLDKQNFPSLTSRSFLLELMGGAGHCQRFVNDWLEFKKELADFDKVVIE